MHAGLNYILLINISIPVMSFKLAAWIKLFPDRLVPYIGIKRLLLLRREIKEYPVLCLGGTSKCNLWVVSILIRSKHLLQMVALRSNNVSKCAAAIIASLYFRSGKMIHTSPPIYFVVISLPVLCAPAVKIC
jgi:hypothetical protein